MGAGPCPPAILAEQKRWYAGWLNPESAGPPFLRLTASLLRRVYLATCAVILSVTAAGKVVSLWPDSPRLGNPDPLFSFIRHGELLAVITSLEIAIALAIQLLPPRVSLKLILSLATVFVLYHTALALNGFAIHCNCLGGLLPPHFLTTPTQSRIVFGLLGYLLLGSTAFLLAERRCGSGYRDIQKGIDS